MKKNTATPKQMRIIYIKLQATTIPTNTAKSSMDKLEMIFGELWRTTDEESEKERERGWSVAWVDQTV